jgi:hypothetical protein
MRTMLREHIPKYQTLAIFSLLQEQIGSLNLKRERWCTCQKTKLLQLSMLLKRFGRTKKSKK